MAKRDLTAKEENVLVAKQWQTFSKTLAYKKFRDYITFQDQAAIIGAKGPVMTFDDESGSQLSFNPQNAANLLQRSIGYDIVIEYVDGYVNFTTPEDVSKS